MKIISPAIKARREEIRLYDVNIYNYQHMLRSLAGKPEFGDFCDELRARIGAEHHEKQKALAVLAALESQRKLAPWWKRWAV